MSTSSILSNRAFRTSLVSSQKQKTKFFVRIRDVEGAEGGANRNERRDDCYVMEFILLSEVRWSTGAKRTPEQARRQQGREVRRMVPERPN